MNFRRTSASLESVHAFYGVDLVIYCEGGPSLAAADAIYGVTNELTMDLLYWTNVVKTIGVEKDFHIKSVGSKTALRSIAQDAAERKLSSISVCMDADYDSLTNTLMNNPRVAVTYGHSWESDVLQPETFQGLIIHYIGSAPKRIVDSLRLSLDEISTDLSYWTEVDICAATAGYKCIFDRSKVLSSLKQSENFSKLDIDRLRKRMNEIGYGRKPRRLVKIDRCDAFKLAYGKLSARLIFNNFIKSMRKMFPGFKANFEEFMRIAISVTFGLLEKNAMDVYSDHLKSLRPKFQ